MKSKIEKKKVIRSMKGMVGKMEERKTIYDYLAQVLMIFGFTMIILNLFCYLFGEDAKEYSTMFALGREGIKTDTMMQYLMASAFTVLFRFLFFTDMVIQNWRVVTRTICMIVSEILMITVFVLVFGWFPVDMWQSWGLFLVCFGLCFAASVTVTITKERVENRKMEAALKKLKEQKKTE